MARKDIQISRTERPSIFHLSKRSPDPGKTKRLFSGEALLGAITRNLIDIISRLPPCQAGMFDKYFLNRRGFRFPWTPLKDQFVVALAQELEATGILA